jgi:hypothetical protein
MLGAARVTGALRAAAELAAIVEDEALDLEGARKLVMALEDLAAKARTRALHLALLEAIARHPGSTSNALAALVPGDRALVLRRLRELGRAGAIRFEPGPKGSRLWYARKTSAALSTGARKRVALEAR